MYHISLYFIMQLNIGTVCFSELPKTDNVYSPTSKYYGCTLAPGIPLIPNLCRRPLRSPGSDEYEYSFTSNFLPTQPQFSKSQGRGFADENHSNHFSSLIEERNNHSKSGDLILHYQVIEQLNHLKSQIHSLYKRQAIQTLLGPVPLIHHKAFLVV